ncbi:MAG: cytochrome o ubiquinol oxidase subunit IV [Telluria sp.]
MNAHHPSTPSSSHGSVGSYAVGLAISFVLTIASFGVVMGDIVPRHLRLAAIVVLCIVQLLAQLVWFLHLGTRKDQRENTVVFICTGFLIAIIVAGSLWVMHNANTNMMPTHLTPEAARLHD